MNTKYRRDASIAAMTGLLAYDLNTIDLMIADSYGDGKHTFLSGIAALSHDFAEALLAEEIKRHGGDVGNPISGDWITWSGGECPVSPDTVVEVELRSMRRVKSIAGSLDWSITQVTGDIIRYRVVEG